MTLGGGAPAPVINCDSRLAVQCDMELLLRLYPCALAILAAHSAMCIENCELHNARHYKHQHHTAAVQLGTHTYRTVALIIEHNSLNNLCLQT
jgi:hypothetical protein